MTIPIVEDRGRCHERQALTRPAKVIVVVPARLTPHIESIVAGHRNKVPLGLVESINSKIAALRVQARGYSDPE